MISQRELLEHRSYLEDQRRIDAYRNALAEMVKPGDAVLDLGAGTGILGYLACEAGAGSVVAVERGDIIELAKRIAEDNDFGNRITHVKGTSSEIALGTKFDVVVCDQIGGLVHDAGILTMFADARDRFLSPGGRMIPSSFRIFACPVQYDEARGNVEFWSSSPGQVDVRAIRSIAANTEWMIHLDSDDLAPLSTRHELAAFNSDYDGPISSAATYSVNAPGRLDGFVGWFETELSPSQTLTNDPWSPERFRRWCNFYPIDEPIEVEVGDQLKLEMDIRPSGGVVSWIVDISNGAGVHRVRQSTFLSASRRDLLGITDAVPTSQVGPAIAVLSLVDGVKSEKEIVEAMVGEVGSLFESRGHLENFVRKVVGVIR